jgi:hypothetical protein
MNNDDDIITGRAMTQAAFDAEKHIKNIEQGDEETLDLTQKEIFDNMTKGEWSLQREFIVSLNKRKPLFDSFNLPDSAAIVSAINNTYGKGINPESVELMQSALQQLKSYFKEQSIGRDLIEEALTAAKL